MGDKIDGRFIQVLELLSMASYQSQTEKIPTLDRTLAGIDTLKFLLRISWEIKMLDEKKYATLSEGLQEAGRQIGGWRKGLKTKTSALAEETR